MARIGIAGFLHETNTFATTATTLAHFIEADAWPGLTVGAQIFPAVSNMNLAISGFVAAMEQTEHTLTPLLWCSANPSGTVEQEAFDTIAGQIDALLADSLPLDALFLDLHGAMVTQHHEDGEGELLARLRKRLGPGIPIVAALDFHANISTKMVDNANMLLAYRTYPHVDMAETGRRAAHALQRVLTAGTVCHAVRQVPFVIPMPWQSTLGEPMASLMNAARLLENEEVFDAQFIPGFPLADIRDCGPTILVYAATQFAADQAAHHLFDRVVLNKEEFSGKLLSVTQAAEYAVLEQPAQKFILADTQDNPGGGGSGDTTDLLHELYRLGATDVCGGIICDPVFAAAAHTAGPGRRVYEVLGGRAGVGGKSLAAPFEVIALGNGRLVGTGPFYLGCHMDLGPMALVRAGGIDIVISSRKQQAADQAMFRHVNAEPADYRILVLKSSVHFRADFTSLGHEILVVKAPGVNTADLHALTYRHLRAGVDIL